MKLKMYPNKYGANPVRMFMAETEYFTIKNIKLFTKHAGGYFVKIDYKEEQIWDGNFVNISKEQKINLENACIEMYEKEVGGVGATIQTGQVGQTQTGQELYNEEIKLCSMCDNPKANGKKMCNDCDSMISGFQMKTPTPLDEAELKKVADDLLAKKINEEE